MVNILEEIQENISIILNSIYDSTIDELDTEFDFNNIGVFFTTNTSNAIGNRDKVSLQIYLISNKNNKIQMENLAEAIDENINNTVLSCNAIIRRPGVWMNSFIDDDGLQNILLSYLVDKF